LRALPTGATVPAYYGLVAARYLHESGATEVELAELAVLMRKHARSRSGAHLTGPMTVADVLASKPIATPLKLMDCCPISDGGSAFVLSRADQAGARGIRIAGWGEAHTHQHLSAAPDDVAVGARIAAQRAFDLAGRTREEVGCLGLYDSFTATLAILAEATGFAPPGGAGRAAREGLFSQHGRFPMNLHGGLLSYGHCGVAGGMAMVAEAVTQLRGEAEARQAASTRLAFVHADGGVSSSHVSLVLERP
jgi:acetyl-CoA acetyltransferase